MKKSDIFLIGAALVMLTGLALFVTGSYFVHFCADEDAKDAALACDASLEQMRSMQLVREFQSTLRTFEKKAMYFMRLETARAVIQAVKNEANADITTDLILRLIWRESRFNPSAIGRQGEIGLTQIKPHIAALHGFSREDLFDPIKNVHAGARELKRLVLVMKSRDLALAAYAGGPTAALYYARDVKE